MSNPLNESRVDQLITDYLAGSLSDADRPAFEDWLRASPDHPRRVADLSATDYAIREVCQDTKAGYLVDVLKELDASDNPAQPVNITEELNHKHRDPDEHDNPAALSAHDIAAVGGYLLRRALLSKPAFGAYAAAVVLLASAVLIPWGSTPQQPVPPMTHTYPDPPAAAAVVATLTAEHNAEWDRRPGGDLFTDQRLVLNRGFAEITTRDGAVVVLEAPATIQLIDDNALHLHVGKLVGICETESSKGFLVRTPHMEITDLGTEFGVEVDGDRSTRVAVYDGEVSVQARHGTRLDGEPVRLRHNQAAAVYADQAAVVRVAYDANVFERRVVRRLDVVDIVAGGDGLGRREGGGIDLADGGFVSNKVMSEKTIEDWEVVAGGPLAVQESKVIDSVFVIDPFANRSVLSTRGDTFEGFSVKQEAPLVIDVQGFGYIQANRIDSIVQPSDNRVRISNTYASGDWPKLSGRAFVIHSAAGLTIDLHAVGHGSTDQSAGRFTANVLNAEALNRTPFNQHQLATADIWVIIDGEPRFTHRSIRTMDGVIEIDVALKAEDRFLTLAVSQGSENRITHDWVVWEQPRIELWQERPGF